MYSKYTIILYLNCTVYKIAVSSVDENNNTTVMAGGNTTFSDSGNASFINAEPPWKSRINYVSI